jgi:hypothetical protein
MSPRDLHALAERGTFRLVMNDWIQTDTPMSPYCPHSHCRVRPVYISGKVYLYFSHKHNQFIKSTGWSSETKRRLLTMTIIWQLQRKGWSATVFVTIGLQWHHVLYVYGWSYPSLPSAHSRPKQSCFHKRAERSICWAGDSFQSSVHWQQLFPTYIYMV